MRLRKIKEGIYMKGENELRLSQEAICEFVESHWNNKITMHDSDKIKVEQVRYDPKSKKFVVLFKQKLQVR